MGAPDSLRLFWGAMGNRGNTGSHAWRARKLIALATGVIVAAGSMLASAMPSRADLKLCNATSSRLGVSLGYQDQNGWATEGWWNISAQSCETLLKGPVPSRFIYVHAVDYDRGGEWAGTNFMCTQDKSYAIRGVQDCQKRGYRRSGFFEVDTGEARDWTIRLSDPDEASKSRQ